jgi:RimJ/RimL family protein N-acetyltransferase
VRERRLGSRETARLWLEPWSDRHSGALAAANADPEVMRFIGSGAVMSAEASAAQSARFAQHWDRFGFGLWGVRVKASDRTVGFAGLSHPLWLAGFETAVEVGWRLQRAAWGRGVATEAGRAAVQAAFDDLGAPEVLSLIHPDNAASAAVARKLGLSLRERVTNPRAGAPVDVYAIAAPGPG